MFTTMRYASLDSRPKVCRRVPDSWPLLKKHCYEIAKPSGNIRKAQQRLKDRIPAVPEKRNLLFIGKQTATGFADHTAQYDVDRPGWSWNSKLNDLDQDGWQDLLVMTGTVGMLNSPTNVFYRNNGNGKFVDETGKSGIVDYTPSMANVVVDYDRDGDMDIIRAPSIGSTIIHRNDGQNGNGFRVKLRDETGNTHAIGATVTITADGLRMKRTIKASGGFVSFDPLQANFGIGAANQVTQLSVKWPDGSISTVNGPLSANTEMVIKRAPGNS